MNYSAIIIDDEERNLKLIEHYLIKYCPLIEIAASYTDFNQAIKGINEHKPAILYLDIQLGKQTAFDLLDEIDTTDLEIVLVTAYDHYALKAFKYSVVDYVLKPIAIEELINATNLAISRVKQKRNFEISLGLEKEESVFLKSEFLTITSLDKIDIVKKDDILFCKSDGRYTTFYLKNKSEIVACKNLGEFEPSLKEDIFFRIHQSYIVNMEKVVCVHKRNGHYCEMSNGARLPIAKRRIEDFNKYLKIKQ